MIYKDCVLWLAAFPGAGRGAHLSDEGLCGHLCQGLGESACASGPGTCLSVPL